jgi:hypothetical protein
MLADIYTLWAECQGSKAVPGTISRLAKMLWLYCIVLFVAMHRSVEAAF